MVSCPGKVLLAGGYVVACDGKGVVVTLSCRIHSIVKESSVDGVVVHAPQFHPEPFQLKKVPNVFLESAVDKVLHYYQKQPKFILKINGDEEFYSEQGKTGLGSSAALVSSIVGAFVLLFEGTLNRKTIFQIALDAHREAQGGLGSGFDVSAAVYGTQMYCMEQHTSIDFPFEVMLIDTKLGGSSTKVMLNQVLFHKHSNEFKELQRASEALFHNLSRYSFDGVREAMRNLGTVAKVEIECSEQTYFLDLFEEVHGVIGVGVPGAGGRDAVFVVYEPFAFEELKSLASRLKLRILNVQKDNEGIKE